jgi:hypothetical protein
MVVEKRVGIEKRREKKKVLRFNINVAAKCFSNSYKEILPSSSPAKTTEELNGRLEYQGNLSATLYRYLFDVVCVCQTDNELWRDSILC